MTEHDERISAIALPGTQRSFVDANVRVAVMGGIGGSGKTCGLLLSALRGIQNENYEGIIFTKKFSQITYPDGLLDQSRCLYEAFDGVYAASRMQWEFLSGASIRFGCVHDLGNVQKRYDGCNFGFVGIDTATALTEEEFGFLLSINCSRCVRPYVEPRMRLAVDAKGVSWLKRKLGWWLDSDGWPIGQRCGISREREGYEWVFFNGSPRDNPKKSVLYLKAADSIPREDWERLMGRWV